MMFSQISMPVGRAGQIAESGNCQKISQYSANAGGSCDESTFSFVIAPGTVVAPTCDAVCSEANSLTITAFPPGRCCSSSPSVSIPIIDLLKASTSADMGALVLCALNSTPQIVALGSFAYDSATGEFRFKARFSSFPVDFAITGPGVTSVVKNTKPATSGAVNLQAGWAAVTSAGAYDVAHHPTMDVSLATSTECWAGIVLSCSGGGEQAPATAAWPNFGNCDSACAPAPTCLQVLRDGTIWLDIGSAPTGCHLFYKFGGVNAGEISGTGGPGFAPIPVPHRVVSIYGSLAKVQFG